MRSMPSRSFRDLTQDSTLCLEIENLGWSTFEGPDSHGSRTTLKVFFIDWRTGGKAVGSGWKVKRNEASELRCLTVNDIFAV